MDNRQYLLKKYKQRQKRQKQKDKKEKYGNGIQYILLSGRLKLECDNVEMWECENLAYI